MSVRRSRSLASLSDQIMGNQRPQLPPKPFPRYRGRQLISPTSGPSKSFMPIDPHSFLRQPVRQRNRSSDNLCSPRRSDSSGQCVIQYFEVCGQTCRFTSAPKIASLPNGNIVATDYKTQKVYRFSEDGVILNSFKVGSNGKDVHPIGLATTKKGKIVVTCGGTVRIFAPNGKSCRKFGNGMFGKSCGVSCDFRANKLVVSDIEKRYYRINNSQELSQHTFSF